MGCVSPPRESISSMPRASSMGSWRSSKTVPLLLLAGAVVLWEIATLGPRADFVLPPTEIARDFVGAVASGELLPHVPASLTRALPLVFAGLRVSLALSFILLFSTEMINARSGLGFLIRQAESNLRFDLMYVSIVAVAALGYASDRLLLLARRRALAWQEAGSA